MFGQNCSRPARQLGQVWSESTRQPTPTRSPALYFVTAEPTFVTRPTISWPGHARVDRGHDVVPLVAGVVEVGVADAAEEDLDLHVAVGRVAPRDRGRGQRRGRAGGGVGLRLVHESMLLVDVRIRLDQAPYCSSLTFSIHSTALPSSCFLDGDVGHGRGRRGPVPVLLARREPDHVARPDLLDRPAPALRPAAAGGDDQRLAERVRVPRRAGAGLERDARAGRRGPGRSAGTAGRCAPCR